MDRFHIIVLHPESLGLFGFHVHGSEIEDAGPCLYLLKFLSIENCLTVPDILVSLWLSEQFLLHHLKRVGFKLQLLAAIQFILVTKLGDE